MATSYNAANIVEAGDTVEGLGGSCSDCTVDDPEVSEDEVVPSSSFNAAYEQFESQIQSSRNAMNRRFSNARRTSARSTITPRSYVSPLLPSALTPTDRRRTVFHPVNLPDDSSDSDVIMLPARSSGILSSASTAAVLASRSATPLLHLDSTATTSIDSCVFDSTIFPHVQEEPNASVVPVATQSAPICVDQPIRTRSQRLAVPLEPSMSASQTRIQTHTDPVIAASTRSKKVFLRPQVVSVVIPKTRTPPQVLRRSTRNR